MNVAVLSLTRDRLAYTRHCFQTLRDNAGIAFDWFVLDQASDDGTGAWLLDQDDMNVTLLSENVGICRGLNLLLDEAVNAADYDVIVRFDNDCEVLQPDTLRAVAELASEYGVILAPRVLGLKNPPAALSEFTLGGIERRTDGRLEWVDETAILGGIFMAIPAAIFSEAGYRYDESHPAWTGDEAICAWLRSRGGRCGYLRRFEVNHYLTSAGQETDDVDYLHRKTREMATR